jgi:hypothetical protein
MVSEGHAAVWTLKGEATIWAEDEIGKPPSIEKEKTLLFILDVSLKRLPDPLGKETLSFLDVNHLHLGERFPFNSLWES